MSRRALWIVGSVLAMGAFGGSLWGVTRWSRYPAPEHVALSDAEAAVTYLRCRAEGGDCTLDSSLLSTRNGESVLFAGVYRTGRRRATYVGQGQSRREALRALGDELEAAFRHSGVAPEAVRIRLDVLVSQGPVLQSVPALFSLSVVPGLDGLALRIGRHAAWLLPHVLHEEDLLTAFKPFAFMDLRFGVDPYRVRSILQDAQDGRDSLAVLSRAIEGEAYERELFRFRTDSFIEIEPSEVIALYRNSPRSQPVTRQSVEAAIEAAADWILSAQMEDGRFHYMYDPVRDRYLDPDYSLTRHAGTALFLLQAYGHTGEVDYLQSAEKALDYLWDRTTRPCGRSQTACVGTGRIVGLGLTALSLAAFAEHVLVGREDSLPRARELGSFVLMMQKPDGNFYHQYTIGGGIDEEAFRFYQTGEAAYALARLAVADPGESVWREALRRTLEYWEGPYWNHLAGGFFFAEEHWTCLAVEAAGELFDEERYDRFCYDIADFLGRLLHSETSSPFADFAGGVGFGVLFPPHTTPTATRVEAMVAAYRLSVARGEPNQALAEKLRLAYGFLLSAQYDDRYASLVPNIERARGGFRESPVVPLGRIDYNQHAGSALLRGVDLLFGDAGPE